MQGGRAGRRRGKGGSERRLARLAQVPARAGPAGAAAGCARRCAEGARRGQLVDAARARGWPRRLSHATRAHLRGAGDGCVVLRRRARRQGTAAGNCRQGPERRAGAPGADRGAAAADAGLLGSRGFKRRPSLRWVRGTRVRFRRESLRDSFHRQGEQQARKLPTGATPRRSGASRLRAGRARRSAARGEPRSTLVPAGAVIPGRRVPRGVTEIKGPSPGGAPAQAPGARSRGRAGARGARSSAAAGGAAGEGCSLGPGRAERQRKRPPSAGSSARDESRGSDGA